MKLGELFKSLATKAGVDINDLATKSADFAGLLSLAAEVPDAVANQIETALLTMDSAKSHPDLKRHFFAALADGMDASLKKIAQKRQIPDADWAPIESEKSTVKKMEMLTDKLLELRDAKDNATSKTEKGQLQKQIEELQEQLRLTKEGHTTELDNRQKTFSARETGLMVEAILAGKNYANKELPKGVSIITAKTLIDQALAKEGLMVVNKDGVIRVLKQDGSDYYDSKHNKVDADGFFDGVLSSNKLLAVTDQSKTGDPSHQQQTIVTGDDKKVNTRLLEANQASLGALATSGFNA
ncbi:MAG TPA: hypothetical protein VFE32_17430 [Puia sp.]|jgi:hypothetical protein|nr:hypothetical protein [Puia sp.]